MSKFAARESSGKGARKNYVMHPGLTFWSISTTFFLSKKTVGSSVGLMSTI